MPQLDPSVLRLHLGNEALIAEKRLEYKVALVVKGGDPSPPPSARHAARGAPRLSKEGLRERAVGEELVMHVDAAAAGRGGLTLSIAFVEGGQSRGAKHA